MRAEATAISTIARPMVVTTTAAVSTTATIGHTTARIQMGFEWYHLQLALCKLYPRSVKSEANVNDSTSLDLRKLLSMFSRMCKFIV